MRWQGLIVILLLICSLASAMVALAIGLIQGDVDAYYTWVVICAGFLGMVPVIAILGYSLEKITE